MILRKYQEFAIKSANQALDKYSNTIVVAPTGSGKTIMLSALIGERYKKEKNVLVVQHRDELVAQNNSKFLKVNPKISTSVVDGTEKDWSGDVVFTMIQTLSRDNNLESIPKIDLVVVDESHHVAAKSYKKVIKKIKNNNPSFKIIGFTATPNRGDKKGLNDIFNNCSHQIEIGTLIREGFLVKPKTFVIDVGVKEELNNVRKTVDDFDMSEVETIMNTTVINSKVVNEWHDKASDRKTIVFCSTIKHAENLLEEFLNKGVKSEIVTGETPKLDRKRILNDLEFGGTQVIINVAVLTEGFDAPPVSCIVLTRPCSYKSTMVQMIGRGLRPVDPEVHKNIIKKDCIVLDFGCSVLTHGSIDETVDLQGKDKNEVGECPTKTCPECGCEIPLNSKECIFCGCVFKSIENKSELCEFNLTEVDIFNLSPFRWLDLEGDGKILVASGFDGFGLVATFGDTSIGLVKRRKHKVITVSIGTRVQAITAADDYLRQIETSNSANKSKLWLNQKLSEKQRDLLDDMGISVDFFDLSWTKYKAACWLNYLWNKKIIHIILDKKLGADYHG